MSPTNPKVDFYFNKAKQWQPELATLRTTALDCGLTEELKWGVPCYTSGGKNIALIHSFKEYCAVLFFKGALLQDAENLLVQQTENVQATRQLRFAGIQEIADRKAIITAYLHEAIEIEKAGLQVELKKTADFTVSEEFQRKLDQNSAFETAFYALTPGRQRAYLLYFSAAKQAKTREARVENYAPHILTGKGLDDA